MKDATQLAEELKTIAVDNGADLFGVADLTGARAFIEEQGGQLLAAFPRAISVAMRLSPVMVEQVADKESVGAAKTYRFYVYEAINPNLDRITTLVTRRLTQEGYRAFMVPASNTVDREKLRGVFSHKLAAHLAGLGFIGKSCLLVTDQYGAQVRFGTVLTDAPLASGKPKEGECGACSRCVEVCPPKAFTGIAFRPQDPRAVRFKAELCDRFMSHRLEKVGAFVCGLCILACDGTPHASQA